MTLFFCLMSSDFFIRDSLAVWTGLEPATPCVTGRYSNQLNYHTVLGLAYKRFPSRLQCKDNTLF